MISRTYILQNLRQLDSAYRSAKYPKYNLYFSKLALLELCGWIELSMDDVVICHARRKRLGTNYFRTYESTVVKKTWGFEYDRHFKSMLLRLVGMIDLERLEVQINAAVRVKMTAQLSSLAQVRGGLAHTYVKGTTAQIDAPSVTLSRFADIYNGLREFETKLRTL